MHRQSARLNTDEKLARRLQAEFDAAVAAGSSSSESSPSSSDSDYVAEEGDEQKDEASDKQFAFNGESAEAELTDADAARKLFLETAARAKGKTSQDKLIFMDVEFEALDAASPVCQIAAFSLDLRVVFYRYSD